MMSIFAPIGPPAERSLKNRIGSHHDEHCNQIYFDLVTCGTQSIRCDVDDHGANDKKARDEAPSTSS
jgi:hypothetical protein